MPILLPVLNKISKLKMDKLKNEHVFFKLRNNQIINRLSAQQHKNKKGWNCRVGYSVANQTKYNYKTSISRKLYNFKICEQKEIRCWKWRLFFFLSLEAANQTIVFLGFFFFFNFCLTAYDQFVLYLKEVVLSWCNNWEVTNFLILSLKVILFCCLMLIRSSPRFLAQAITNR